MFFVGIKIFIVNHQVRKCLRIFEGIVIVVIVIIVDGMLFVSKMIAIIRIQEFVGYVSVSYVVVMQKTSAFNRKSRTGKRAWKRERESKCNAFSFLFVSFGVVKFYILLEICINFLHIRNACRRPTAHNTQHTSQFHSFVIFYRKMGKWFSRASDHACVWKCASA